MKSRTPSKKAPKPKHVFPIGLVVSTVEKHCDYSSEEKTAMALHNFGVTAEYFWDIVRHHDAFKLWPDPLKETIYNKLRDLELGLKFQKKI